MIVKRGSAGDTKELTTICSSSALAVGGSGVRFQVTNGIRTWPAFVVRHSKGVSAYINRCAHLDLQLDWDPGNFFDIDKQHLICATHGALYTANTGECVSGPCNGLGLELVQVLEIEGNVYLDDPIYVSILQEAKA